MLYYLLSFYGFRFFDMNYVKRHAERAPIYLKRDECNILHAFSLYPFRFCKNVFTTFSILFFFGTAFLTRFTKKKSRC
jgi:hypothetical protein